MNLIAHQCCWFCAGELNYIAFFWMSCEKCKTYFRFFKELTHHNPTIECWFNINFSYKYHYVMIFDNVGPLLDSIDILDHDNISYKEYTSIFRELDINPVTHSQQDIKDMFKIIENIIIFK